MMKIQELLETKLGKTIKEASNAEVYYALLHVVQNMAKDKEVPVKKKKIYYISAEFLIGKLLSNNMINLGIYDDVKKMLAENGKDICEIEEIIILDYSNRNLKMNYKMQFQTHGLKKRAG